MKKYIKQIAAFALIAVLASCDSADDNVNLTSVGGNAAPATSSISRLDNNYALPLNTYPKEGVTVSKVEIFKNTAKVTSDPIIFGDKVADATLAEGKATFNTSTLGSFDVFPVTSGGVTTLTGKTGSFSLAILTTYSDGSTTRAPWTLTVGKGISWQGYDDTGKLVNTTSSGVSSILYEDPTPAFIHIAPVKKGTTTVTSIVGYWSKNDSGTFAELPLTIKNTGESIDLAAIPYTTYGALVAGDKITYRFIITAGSQTDQISTSVTFDNQEFGSSSAGSISNTASTFSFATGDNSASEIEFNSPFGIIVSGKTPINFVKSPLAYATADLFTAEAAYTSGTKVTELTNLVVGDVVVYKITRKVNFGTESDPDIQDVLYTGILTITDKVQGTTSQELKFSYKEGVLHK